MLQGHESSGPQAALPRWHRAHYQARLLHVVFMWFAHHRSPAFAMVKSNKTCLVACRPGWRSRAERAAHHGWAATPRVANLCPETAYPAAQVCAS